jgi:hypothetical protein
VIVTTFPSTVCVIERTLIPLKDGTTLRAAPATFPFGGASALWTGDQLSPRMMIIRSGAEERPGSPSVSLESVAAVAVMFGAHMIEQAKLVSKERCHADLHLPRAF